MYKKKNANGFAKSNYVHRTQNNNGKAIMGKMNSSFHNNKTNNKGNINISINNVSIMTNLMDFGHHVGSSNIYMQVQQKK
jgi:hypothetical protein